METRGVFLIRGSWEIHTYSIIGVIFIDADAGTYNYEPMGKILASWENQNKYNNVKHCHNQWKIFSVFPISVWHDR